MPVNSSTNNTLGGSELAGFQDSHTLGTLQIHAIHENNISFEFRNSAHVTVGR